MFAQLRRHCDLQLYTPGGISRNGDASAPVRPKCLTHVVGEVEDVVVALSAVVYQVRIYT